MESANDCCSMLLYDNIIVIFRKIHRDLCRDPLLFFLYDNEMSDFVTEGKQIMFAGDATVVVSSQCPVELKIIIVIIVVFMQLNQKVSVYCTRRDIVKRDC